MSTIKYDGKCAKCGRGPIAMGIPVFRDLEAGGTGKSGIEKVVFALIVLGNYFTKREKTK